MGREDTGAESLSGCLFLPCLLWAFKILPARYTNFDDMNQDLAIANDALVSSVGQLEGFLQQPFKPYLCCYLKQITVHFPTHKATCQSMGHIHTAKLFSSKKILGSYNLPCGDSLCGLWSPLATTRHALGECWLAEANTASRSMNDHS